MAAELSPWELIVSASFLVKVVMLMLVLASIVSWVMIVQRGLFLNQSRRLFQSFEQNFWSGIDLNELFRDGSARVQQNRMVSGAESVFRAGFREFNRLTKKGSPDPDAVIEGTERAMRVALSREEEKLNANLPFLASVASTSPYIGLFGTVWGIMQSFLGLANVQQATLAVVAPGIAEALIATAMGLFAAIPAVLAFNRYSAQADNLFGSYQTFAEEFSSILHRRVHSK
ncbi:protein TolQ [Porticoccus sp. W117]|uniref:protein TolQ n=1 Tax=Porticoccus sp. W117 TaxID=3054777 RepID=UPI00259477BD|nr:protein TolQ [Porticoccus sp. W117]MDM3871245.1 protein TolQ [Porticoccus sp. W117]